MKSQIKRVPLPKDSPEPQRSRLRSDLTLIVNCCLEKFTDVRSIILYGGYGRKEGSWIQNDGQWFPYNDYDIVVVTNKKIPKPNIGRIRKELASEIGINWVDLSQKKPWRLRFLNGSIYNYDLKYASTVIWGDDHIIDLIPPINSARLRSYEIVTLFFTRLWPFLGVLDDRSFQFGLSGERARLFRNQMAKAILATVDVNLLMRGLYTPSYVERVGRSLQYYESVDVGLVEFALAEKLRPSDAPMTGDEVREMFERVHTLYSKVMLEGLSFHYKEEFADDTRLLKRYERGRRWNPLRFMHLLNGSLIDYDKETQINVVQAHLFFSFSTRTNLQSETLKLAIAHVNQLVSKAERSTNWFTCAMMIATLRNDL